MKWCAMEDAASIDDPEAVCEDNFKDVLWRRHERASECIWIPQCRITLRSGSAAPKTNFTTPTDMNTMVGDPGDLIFSPTGFLPLDPTLEINERLIACDANWMAQPKGILTLALGRFIGEEGQASSIRGLAADSATSPVVLIVDPEAIPSGVDQHTECSRPCSPGSAVVQRHRKPAGPAPLTGHTVGPRRRDGLREALHLEFDGHQRAGAGAGIRVGVAARNREADDQDGRRAPTGVGARGNTSGDSFQSFAAPPNRPDRARSILRPTLSRPTTVARTAGQRSARSGGRLTSNVAVADSTAIAEW